MKLHEILNETVKGDYYAVELEDGGGFGIQADNINQARRKAKTRLHTGDKIKSVVKDAHLTSLFNDRKEKLIKFVTNHYLIKNTPSIQKGYLRQIKKARTGADINAIDSKIQSELKARMNLTEW